MHVKKIDKKYESIKKDVTKVSEALDIKQASF